MHYWGHNFYQCLISKCKTPQTNKNEKEKEKKKAIFCGMSCEGVTERQQGGTTSTSGTEEQLDERHGERLGQAERRSFTDLV